MIALLTGAIGLAVAAIITWLIRKDRLHVNHGLGWLLVAGVFALLGFAPSLIDRLAIWLGIGYPPVLALTLAVTGLVIKILLMDIERSELQMRNQRLTQRLAMLEADIARLESRDSGVGDGEGTVVREAGARGAAEGDEQRNGP